RGILVLVGLDGLGDRVGFRRVAGETTGVQRPEIPFRAALYDPLGERLPRTSGLCDPKAERVAMKKAGQPVRGPDVWQSVGRGGVRAVDDRLDAGPGQWRYAPAGGPDIGFEPLEVVRPEFVCEILWNCVEPPSCGCVLVGPQNQSTALLAQVVGDIRVAQQGQ